MNPRSDPQRWSTGVIRDFPPMQQGRMALVLRSEKLYRQW
jgi:hypothetical protein